MRLGMIGGDLDVEDMKTIESVDGMPMKEAPKEYELCMVCHYALDLNAYPGGYKKNRGLIPHRSPDCPGKILHMIEVME
jgi:hypothetical protein